MPKNRTEEDWFLRGGERPSTKTPYDEPQVPDEGNPHDTDPCDECDGRTRCDDCPHNLDDEDEDEDEDDRETREFRVRIVASQPVETFVIVTATDEEDACDKVADILNNDGEFDPEAQDWDPVGSVDDPEIDDTDVEEL